MPRSRQRWSSGQRLAGLEQRRRQRCLYLRGGDPALGRPQRPRLCREAVQRGADGLVEVVDLLRYHQAVHAVPCGTIRQCTQHIGAVGAARTHKGWHAAGPGRQGGRQTGSLPCAGSPSAAACCRALAPPPPSLGQSGSRRQLPCCRRTEPRLRPRPWCRPWPLGSTQTPPARRRSACRRASRRRQPPALPPPRRLPSPAAAWRQEVRRPPAAAPPHPPP